MVFRFMALKVQSVYLFEILLSTSETKRCHKSQHNVNHVCSFLYASRLPTKCTDCTVLPTALYRLDVSSSTRITTYQSLRIQLVQNAPDDGPMRSETCRANKKC